MRYPLSGTIVVTGEFMERAQPKTGLIDRHGIRRHIGVDLRARTPLNIYAPGSGKVTASYGSGSALQVIEIQIGNWLWRFLHLSQRNMRVGQLVREGEVIGKTGASGGVAPHLHVDVRKAGTTWSASVYNYVDFRNVIAEANKPKPSAHPYGKYVGRSVFLKPKDPSYSGFIRNTDTRLGGINTLPSGQLYVVRDVSARKNRIVVKSASLGRNQAGNLIDLPVAPSSSPNSIYPDVQFK